MTSPEIGPKVNIQVTNLENLDREISQRLSGLNFSVTRVGDPSNQTYILSRNDIEESLKSAGLNTDDFMGLMKSRSMDCIIMDDISCVELPYVTK